jgi:hypothetical protein
VDRRVAFAIAGLVPLVCFLSVASAQIEDRLDAYTGRNATGYLGPLAEALGTNLNSGLFHSAYIPEDGFHVSLELAFTTVFFGDDSRYFKATTEGGFTPEQSEVAPTVVGPTESVWLIGDAGTAFAFPGGFDVDNFPIAVPQLRVGAWRGTEAVLRVLVLDTGVPVIRDVNLFGFGARHSLSRYFLDGLPVDLAVAGFWQRAKIKDDDQDVITSNAFSVAIQGSRTYGAVTPYAAVGLDWFDLALSYEFRSFSSDEAIELSFDTGAYVHYTLGFSYGFSFVNAYGEYNLANQNALSVGLAFQYTSSDRSVGP